MGCRNRSFFSEDDTSSSSSPSSASLSEALLFTTMCIVGLPVDVHIKDGSVYSGIFHTASVDKDFGIVLKKARMTKKGKGKTNVGKEGLIDTLVIQSGDLVQVIAKGVMLPADGVGGNIIGGDEEAVVRNVCYSESLTHGVEKCTGSLMDEKQGNQSRQAGDEKPKGKTDSCGQELEFVEEKNAEKIQDLGLSHRIDMCLAQVEAVEHGCTCVTSNPSVDGLFCNNPPASVKAADQSCERSISAESTSTNATQAVNRTTESHNFSAKSIEISVPRSAESTRNAKESKLNPAAKIFSPSFVNPIPATPAVPTAANMAYIPNSSPVVPVAAVQPEVGFNAFASRPSVPVKVAQYGNLTGGNGGAGPQFSQSIVGQLPHRTHPLRYTAYYTSVLSEPAYLQPTSPAVMVGRSGPLVYVHPVSHDLVHGATAISPVSAQPLLNHVQFPKQQGVTVGQAKQLSVPLPPVLTSGLQSYALQSHIPLMQPGSPATRPIPVPAPNGFYGTKFS